MLESRREAVTPAAKIVPQPSTSASGQVRPVGAASSSAVSTAASTPPPPHGVQSVQTPTFSQVDDDDGDEESEISVDMSRHAAPGAASTTAAGTAEAADVQAAIEAATTFLGAPAAHHPALPGFVRAAVEGELRRYGVLSFRDVDAAALSDKTEGMAKAFGESFLVPSARGVTGVAVSKQEGALYARAAESTKMLALLMAARVVTRDKLFGEMSQLMSAAYMNALVELLVKDINSANFSRAQLTLAGAPAARELFIARAVAASDGREHITESPVYAQIEAASSMARLWSVAAPRAASESASTTSASAAKPAPAAATPAKKPRNRKKKKNNNNSSSINATNSTDVKPAATPARSPAKGKQ